MEKEKPKKFRCVKCNSAQTYVLKDGTRVCRKCSYREIKEEKKEDNGGAC
jgi:ribosomal protein L40E